MTLSLTTQLSPTTKFSVDGDEYEMLGLDHLSEDGAAEVMALFSRHALLVQDLSMERTASRGEGIAKRIRNTRITLLSKLTTMPKELAAQLPLSEQLLLLRELQKEILGDEDEDDAEERKDPGGDGE